MPEFYSVVTLSGGEALAAALVAGEPLVLTHLAIGDGEVAPNESMAALMSEKWRGECTVSAHPEQSGWLVATATLPEDTGGYKVREVALYAGEILVAVGNYPETYLPLMPSGARKVVSLEMVVEIATAGAAA